MSDTSKSKEAVSKNRPPCPFYGFVGACGMLMDAKGNACALEGGHTPCSMEMSGQKPSWRECSRFNNEKNASDIKSFLEEGVAFPHELHPPTVRNWSGIPLKDWYQKIMEPK